jgi:hypothetical protein
MADDDIAMSQVVAALSGASDDAPLTFEECRRHACARLTEVTQDLRHWGVLDGLSHAQSDLLAEVRRYLRIAASKLNQAAE